MSDRRIPLFLGRVSYRQRRLADAARLLPIFGAVLMGMPLLWPQGGAEGTPSTSVAMIYVFGCWAVLSLAAAALAAVLTPDADKDLSDALSAEAGDTLADRGAEAARRPMPGPVADTPNDTSADRSADPGASKTASPTPRTPEGL